MVYHTSGVLFKNSFGTREMREVMSEEAFVERFLEVEAALARAEARAGLIPEAAAEEITRKASLDHVDFADIERNVADIGLFTMAIINAWKDAFDGAGEYIHWGATSQDISDMAMVLQLREAHGILLRDLGAVSDSLADLARAYDDTAMIGRTHHVHAIPITFGLKAATWLDELDRGIRRLEGAGDRAFVQQFFGATGTLASLPEGGEAVQENLADELDLAVPNVAWYASRDRLAEWADAVAGVATTLGRIADQVLMLNRPEIGEAMEPIPEGEIGSSTMPHKRNPMRSETASGLARLVRAHATTMTGLNEGYDERDFSTWLMEFAVLPELCLYAARLLANAREVLGGLDVNEDALERNMRLFDGLVTSEAVMMALADHVGRQTAHEIVYEHAMAAIEGDGDFPGRLSADDRVTAHLDAAELDALTDPANYTGYSARFVERTLADLGRN